MRNELVLSTGRSTALVLALCGLLGAGVALGAGKPAPKKPAPKGNHVTVTIDATNYAPKFVTVHPGDTIDWVNKDLLTHTVTARNGSFDSKEIAPGKTWSYTPTTRGQFDYRCTIHPTMKGSLVVQ